MVTTCTHACRDRSVSKRVPGFRIDVEEGPHIEALSASVPKPKSLLSSWFLSWSVQAAITECQRL